MEIHRQRLHKYIMNTLQNTYQNTSEYIRIHQQILGHVYSFEYFEIQGNTTSRGKRARKQHEHGKYT